MKFYSIMIFFICLNLSATFLTISGAFPAPVSPRGSTSDFSGIFVIPQWNWETMAPLIGGGVLAFLSGIFLGNVFAGILVGIAWVFAAFLKPLGWLINQFPLFTYDIVMAICNNDEAFKPLATTVSALFSGVFVFVGFMFVMELFSQRYMT